MLNLIIAEDEIFTAEQINTAVDWAAFGIKVDGIFRNGKDALDYISKNNVDIVITDIKMPVMDGLTLTEKCKEISPHTKFIILSGYREFEFARRSVHLGVVEYLLKPISYTNLISAVSKAVKLFPKPNINTIQFQNSLLLNSRQTLFSNILCGITTSLSDVSLKLSNVGMPNQILNNPCMIINIKFLNFDNFISNKWKYSITQFKDSVTNIIPFETDELYFIMVNFLFDELFIFVATKDSSINFKEYVRIYMMSVTENFREFFSLDTQYNIVSEFENILEVFSNIKQQQDNSTNIDIIDKCKKYISENLKDPITLSDVADYVHLNPVYLSSYFKNKTGINFSAYLKNTRMERAKQLLAHTQNPIFQICEMTGFKSESHFYKSFKDTFDVTPQQYRERFFKE